ncbi:MAG: substrate-binding domain-containing protein [Cyclobacteriaceae bacterium]|nr:substrate-binding domain-containing protein [Cyclobacteriaceae bacterium]
MSIPKNVRIKDIARLAGVSVGTVDRVLHNRGRVSEDALQKVTAVMEQIDYRPNLIARTLGSNKSYRIAALIPDPTVDPYWAQSNQGLIQATAEWAQYGIDINLYFFDLFDKESFTKKGQEVFEAKPDGILAAPIFFDEALLLFKLFKKQGIPYVLFNTNIPEVNPLSFIGQNLFQSGRVGAELMHFGLHQGGLLAVLHIDEDIHNSVHLLEKEKGFREYFKEKSKLAFTIQDFNLSPNDTSFKKNFNLLLDDTQLKGIFVSTSNGTSVAASYLENHGKKNIRLIGYDMLNENLNYLKSGVIDFLINQNPKRQVSVGISHLANYLIFKKRPPETELFPLEIITQQNLDSYLGSGIH